MENENKKQNLIAMFLSGSEVSFDRTVRMNSKDSTIDNSIVDISLSMFYERVRLVYDFDENNVTKTIQIKDDRLFRFEFSTKEYRFINVKTTIKLLFPELDYETALLLDH